MRGKHHATVTPRFAGLKARHAAASRVGAANKRKNTAPELLLRRALWAAGVRYRLHAHDLPGRPDVVIRRARVAVFCDGDFWHGRNWPQRRAKLARGWNASYWIAKIERNRARDRQTAKALRALGWQVVRVWESDVRRAPHRAVMRVQRAMQRLLSTAQAEARWCR
jgi:DNA mismatch endonuclease (patch repair protein)